MMAESTQQAAVAGSDSTQAADRAPARRAHSHLQPLDPRELRHVHHGQTTAMWVGSLTFLVAFIIGGIAMVIGPNWPLFIGACVLGALGIIVGLVLQALGFGLYQKRR